MPEEKSEIDKFFEEISPKEPVVEQAPVEEQPSEEEGKLNRQQRRQIENASIREQLRQEREARLAAEARAEAFAKMKTDGDVDERLHRVLYGDQAPTAETKVVVQNLQTVLDANKQDAIEAAYDRLRQEQESSFAEERQAEAFIDDQLASLEEMTGVDLTSSNPAARKARTEFLEVVERLSPKDEQGNIVEYADFGSAFDLYQQTRKTSSPRRTEIASRSMSKSGESSSLEQDKSAWEKGRDQLRALGLKV